MKIWRPVKSRVKTVASCLFKGRGTRFDARLDKQPSYARLGKIPAMSTVIDVGVGDGGSPFLYSHSPNAFFVSIDPLGECARAVERHLSKDQSVFVQTALGSKDTEATIRVSRKLSRTSLLNRVKHDENSYPTEERAIKIRRLDVVVEELEQAQKFLKAPILLKIDVEGYELECLRGASVTLERCAFVILEAPLTENFAGSYKFSDLIAAMSEKGFEVFQVLKAGNNSIDLLFGKVDDPLRRIWSYGQAI